MAISIRKRAVEFLANTTIVNLSCEGNRIVTMVWVPCDFSESSKRYSWRCDTPTLTTQFANEAAALVYGADTQHHMGSVFRELFQDVLRSEVIL